MNDDPPSPGGEMPPDDRAPAPATDESSPRGAKSETAAPRPDDAGRDFGRQHGEDAAARDEPAARRPARSLQKRIDELVRQRAAAAHDRDRWRERALSASARGDPSVPAGSRQDAPAQDSPAQDAPMPGRDHPADPAASVADAGERSPELAAFAGRIADARARYADFDRVALDPALPISAAMAETIARSDKGPDIAYQLGRSPELARRIAGLDPLSAARELGRLEAALSPAAPRKATGAPPPVAVLDGAESPRRDPDSMSYEQYKRWRSAR